MMKSVFISQKDLVGIYSGVQRKVHEEIRYFRDKDHKVYVCAERINTKAIIESGGTPIKTFRWPFSGLKRRLNYLNRAHKHILKLKPQLVIGHGDIIEQDICYIHNCVHLAYELIHGEKIPSDHEVGIIHKKILTAQKFKVLVCNSKLMQNDLCKRFNIPIEHTKVIYPEYNPKKFQRENIELRNRTRVELGLKDEILISLITSGNFKKRNIAGLLKAAAKLNGDFKLLVVGKDKIDPYIQQAATLGIKDKLIYAPSRHDVEAYYHASDIFILPAFIEEFGRSTLEAMGCSKPVLVSNKVGSSEIIQGKSREYIISPTDTESMHKKLQDLINKPQLRDELGKLNYHTALGHTDVNKNKDFENLLKDIGHFDQ